MQKLIRIVVNEITTPVVSTAPNEFHVFVLASHTLQKWSLTIGEQERLVFECNLENIIAENFIQTVWVSGLDLEERYDCANIHD